MARFLMLGICIVLIAFSWQTIKKELPIRSMETKLQELKSNTDIIAGSDKFQQLLNQLGLKSNDQPQAETVKEEKVSLKKPTKHIFSVNNIELGATKKEVEHRVGKPKRASLNEYGTNWYTYHQHYQHYFMAMYNKSNKVIGLFTNQNLIASTNGIKIGVTKKTVRAKLGTPLTGIQKGMIIYQFDKKSDYDVYLLDGAYVTIFYDKYQQDKVTAIQLMDKNAEQSKNSFYTKASPALVKGFEYQLFDLTNASRVVHHLSVLTWDQHVQITARDHSVDMAKNHYFSHENLKGQSPFDRMSKDHISFILAGENIAYGQLSSIFAHEGLMNSLGHRKNILQKDYKYLGIGVAFNQEQQPFYTEDFYAK
ncbi:CAP domain-containing protein [Bacillus sp. FJAT-49736]|uniref:CAP domain-containing protein n=1 Tax=Bacillus sp. FJAT-49736 TaxID=2833582 RepID=UPI001BC9185D|nr:CAP domain-containing protein [Bacillus sp. FJAT-49736]MBS4172838.1 CAP domain-containing protein [Bacillus sp. FJAT-49736]